MFLAFSNEICILLYSTQRVSFSFSDHFFLLCYTVSINFANITYNSVAIFWDFIRYLEIKFHSTTKRSHDAIFGGTKVNGNQMFNIRNKRNKKFWESNKSLKHEPGSFCNISVLLVSCSRSSSILVSPRRASKVELIFQL